MYGTKYVTEEVNKNMLYTLVDDLVRALYKEKTQKEVNKILLEYLWEHVDFTERPAVSNICQSPGEIKSIISDPGTIWEQR